MWLMNQARELVKKKNMPVEIGKKKKKKLAFKHKYFLSDSW